MQKSKGSGMVVNSVLFFVLKIEVLEFRHVQVLKCNWLDYNNNNKKLIICASNLQIMTLSAAVMVSPTPPTWGTIIATVEQSFHWFVWWKRRMFLGTWVCRLLLCQILFWTEEKKTGKGINVKFTLLPWIKECAGKICFLFPVLVFCKGSFSFSWFDTKHEKTNPGGQAPNLNCTFGL